jgi:hypothetical protein
MAENSKYVVLAGDPVDGFRVVGPFDSSDEAVTWALRRVPDEIHGREAELEDPDTVSWPD